MSLYEADDEAISDEEKAAGYWIGEIERAQKEFKTYHERCDKIAKRYRDERDQNKENAKRFNILWSNIQTMKPAVYAKPPKPVIERRFMERNDIERVAGMALQRCVSVEIETGGFDESVGGKQGAVMDYLLFGRGQVWTRYEADVDDEDSAKQLTDIPEGQGEAVEQSETRLPAVTAERICLDYVHRKDFLHDPARTWAEVRWLAKRSWLTKKQTRKKFDDEVANKVEYKAIDTGEDADRYGDQRRPKEQRAEFWEIWDKIRRKVWIISPGYEDKPCKVSDDPLKLKNFWPCPKPLYGTMTSDTLIPVPDYCEYQDQAEQLDALSERIAKLTQAIKAVGFYDASQSELRTLFELGNDLKMIPVEGWAGMKDKGGLEGSLNFMPLDMLIKARESLELVFEQQLQRLYEVTGIADIVRGNSSPEETYGAQKIKGQFATLRLQDRQREVVAFCREIVLIMTELIAQHFDPETIAAMTGLAEGNSPDAQYFQQAMQMVGDARLRSFRVDIETNSTIELDIQADKEATTEFVNGVAQYFNQIMPAAEKMPQLIPIAGQVLLWAIRRFRTGRELESVFERAVDDFGRMAASGQLNPQAQPNPEQLKLQAMREQAQSDQQMQREKMQSEQQASQRQMQFEMQQHQDDMELQRQQQSGQQQVEREKMAHEATQKELDRQHKERLEQQKMGHEAGLKGQDMAHQHSIEDKKAATTHAVEDKKLGAQHEMQFDQQKHEKGMAKEAIKGEVVKEQSPAIERLEKAIEEMKKMHSAPVEIIRDAKGKATGARRVMH